MRREWRLISEAMLWIRHQWQWRHRARLPWSARARTPTPLEQGPCKPSQQCSWTCLKVSLSIHIISFPLHSLSELYSTAFIFTLYNKLFVFPAYETHRRILNKGNYWGRFSRYFFEHLEEPALAAGRGWYSLNVQNFRHQGGAPDTP